MKVPALVLHATLGVPLEVYPEAQLREQLAVVMAPDPVSQLVVTYPVELDNVQVLAARASETVKVPALVLHVNQEFRWNRNQKCSSV